MKRSGIKSEQEYDKILEWIDKQFDNPPCISSNAGGYLQTALLLVKAYEDIYHPIDN